MSSSRSLLILGSLLAGAVGSNDVDSQRQRANLRATAVNIEQGRSLKSAAQKAAKEAAGAHYYEIKTKTTKAVPDSGLNEAAAATAALADSSEVSEAVEYSLDADYEKKESKRESRKADKKAREEVEESGASVHTWNGEIERKLAGSPTKSPSTGMHKPTWKPSSKPNERRSLSDHGTKHPRPTMTPRTSKPGEKHRDLMSAKELAGKVANKLMFWKHPNGQAMETTASDVKLPVSEETTGSAPEHNEEEPMSPTVMDVDFVDAVNPNGPVSGNVDTEEATEVPLKKSTGKSATVMTSTTASDARIPLPEVPTGLAPEHKVSEPMYPTVVNVELKDVANANGPQSTGPAKKSDVKKENINILKTATEVPKKSDTKALKPTTTAEKMEKSATMTVAKEAVSTTTKPAYEKITAKVDMTPASATSKSMTSSKPLMGSSNKDIPTKSPSTGLHKPTWKPSSKPNESSKSKKNLDKEIGDEPTVVDATLVEIDFGTDYGSFANDDFSAPAPGTKMVMVTQIMQGMGKRAGDWKEKFEDVFVPETAKLLGISKHGVMMDRLDRTDKEVGNSHKKWTLQVTYVVYDVDNDGCLETSRRLTKKASKGEEEVEESDSKGSKRCMTTDEVEAILNDKTNIATVNKALKEAGTGKGNNPEMTSATAITFDATSQPTMDPANAPTDDTPVEEDDDASKYDLGKLVVVKQEITGITKRADDWKANMEAALLPLVANALGIKKAKMAFNEVQRRYESGTVWVEFSFPHEKGLYPSEVQKTIEKESLVATMNKALENAGLGKGNEPAIGQTKVKITEVTMQPAAAPVSTDDDGVADDICKQKDTPIAIKDATKSGSKMYTYMFKGKKYSFTHALPCVPSAKPTSMPVSKPSDDDVDVCDPVKGKTYKHGLPCVPSAKPTSAPANDDEDDVCVETDDDSIAPLPKESSKSSKKNTKRWLTKKSGLPCVPSAKPTPAPTNDDEDDECVETDDDSIAPLPKESSKSSKKNTKRWLTKKSGLPCKPSAKPTGKPSKKPTGKPIKTDMPTDKPIKTAEPSAKPTKKPTSKPTQKPTSKPTKPEPTAKPTHKPSKAPTFAPVVIVKQEVTGITKRARDWKSNMELALEPIIAEALNVKAEDIHYTDVQRRYETGTVWVEYVIPNEKYGFTEHEVVHSLAEAAVIKSMTKALENAGLGKGNVPAVGEVKVDIAKGTAQPSSKPTVAVKPGSDDVVEASPDGTVMTKVTQTVSNVDKDDVQGHAFRSAMEDAVAAALGVNDADVAVADVSVGKDGVATVTYTILDKYNLSKSEVKEELINGSDSIEAALSKQGFEAKVGKPSTSDIMDSSNVSAALPKSLKLKRE